MNSYTYQRESFNQFKEKNTNNTPFNIQNAISICIDWNESKPIDFDIQVTQTQQSSYSSSIPIEFTF